MKYLSTKPWKLTDNKTGSDKQGYIKHYRVGHSGLLKGFFVDKGRDSVQILAVTEDGYVPVVRQIRPGDDTEWIELPGGSVETSDASVEDAGRRELLEETGFDAARIIKIGHSPYSPYSTGIRHFVCASGLKLVNRELDLDPDEELVVELMQLEEVLKLAEECKIRGWEHVLLAKAKCVI